MTTRLNIVVAWKGLPAYGARLIRAGRRRLNYDFPVLATKPDVPIEGMEVILGGNLTWIDPTSKQSWKGLKLSIPDVLIHTGWGYPFFVSLADEVRANGGKVVGMFDNCWKGNMRQLMGGLYFRLFRRRQYAAAWVPGKNARRLAKYIGFPNKLTFESLYGADPSIFACESPIIKRPQQVLFVGRFNHRKGAVELAKAFDSIRLDYPEWKLKLVGEGSLGEQLCANEQVEILPFQQPASIAKHLNESRIFVLPSREEHWGLVVHEAALCGCVLALRDRVGAAADFANSRNSVLFDETSPTAISECLRRAFEWSDAQLIAGSSESLHLSANFGPEAWANTLEAIIEALDDEG